MVGNSNGEFITDENGRIVINDLTPWHHHHRTGGQDGGGLCPGHHAQVHPDQSRRGPNPPLLQHTERRPHHHQKDEETGERISGVQFEVRKLNGEIIGTYTTDKSGVIRPPEAEKGWYQVVELKAAEGYRLDDTPYQIEVKDGQTATLKSPTGRPGVPSFTRSTA